MLEVTGYFTGFDNGGYNRHLSPTMLTLSHIDLYIVLLPRWHIRVQLTPFENTGYQVA